MKREQTQFKTKWLNLQYFANNSWSLQNTSGTLLLCQRSQWTEVREVVQQTQYSIIFGLKSKLSVIRRTKELQLPRVAVG